MKRIIPEIDKIVNFYSPEVIEQIARETGFVQRDSKLGGMEFLALMTQLMTQGLYAQPDATLEQMCGMLKDVEPELEISGPGLQQRIVGSGREFLMEMMSKALELSVTRSVDESIPALLRVFEKVLLLDSTQISLPEKLSSRWAGSGGSASKAGMKLQLMLDYKICALAFASRRKWQVRGDNHR